MSIFKDDHPPKLRYMYADLRATIFKKVKYEPKDYVLRTTGAIDDDQVNSVVVNIKFQVQPL